MSEKLASSSLRRNSLKRQTSLIGTMSLNRAKSVAKVTSSAIQQAAGLGSEDLVEIIIEEPVERTEAEWKQSMSAGEYRILRLGQMEMAGHGKYYQFRHSRSNCGVFKCKGCSANLYESKHALEPTEGYLNMKKPIPGAVCLITDRLSPGVYRYMCAKCTCFIGRKGRSGALVNSVSVTFEPMKLRETRELSRQASKCRDNLVHLTPLDGSRSGRTLEQSFGRNNSRSGKYGRASGLSRGQSIGRQSSEVTA